MPSSECVPPPVRIPGLSVAATPFHRSYALMKNLRSLWRSGLSYCYQRSESCSLHHVGYPVNIKRGITLSHFRDTIYMYLCFKTSPMYDLPYENEIDWQNNEHPSPKLILFYVTDCAPGDPFLKVPAALRIRSHILFFIKLYS